MRAILEPVESGPDGSSEGLESARVTGTEFTRYVVPGWGAGELWVRGGLVLAHDFLYDDNGGSSDDVGSDLPARFIEYFSGQPDDFHDVEIDLGEATAFQRSVTDALRRVPRGEVVSYGELAALAGYPRAARAVGTFCALNRFALIVPCHRVVAAHGIGGYGSAGVEVKRRLLALEGVGL